MNTGGYRYRSPALPASLSGWQHNDSFVPLDPHLPGHQPNDTGTRIVCKIFDTFSRGIPDRDRTNGSRTRCFNSSLDKTRLQLGSTVFAKQRNQACFRKTGNRLTLASIEMPISLSSIASIPIQFRQSIRTAPQKIQEPQLPHEYYRLAKAVRFPPPPR